MGLLGSLGSLNVLLSADTAQFSSAMDKAAYSAEKSLGKIGIHAKLTAVALIAAFIANTKSALSFTLSMDNMSKRLGITAKQMSILSYAAKMSSIDVGSLETAMGMMYKTASKNPKLFEDIGVKVKEASGRYRDGYEIFTDTIEVLRKMPDGVGKASAAMLFFGRTGRDIVPLFTSGTESVKDFEKAAISLGVVLEEESVKNAQRWERGWKTSTEVMKGLGIATVDTITKFVQARGILDYLPKYMVDYWDKISGHTDLAAKANANATEVDKKRAQALADQALAFEQVIEATKKKEKMEEEGSKLTTNLRTAQEIYNDEIQRYNELLSAGTINQETYERALKKSSDTLTESTLKTNKMKDAAKDLGMTFSSAFEDAIINGEKLSDVLVALLQDIERIILRTAVTGPLADALSAGISSFFTRTPSASTSLPSSFETFYPSTATSYSAQGNIFSGNRLIPFGNGGLIDRPSIFPMANGGTGIAGEKGTEAILPLFRTGSGDLGVKSGNSGGVEINIYAPPGSNVRQSSQRVGDKEQINIMIDEAVAGSVNSPGSKTYKALKGTFGLRQSLNAR